MPRVYADLGTSIFASLQCEWDRTAVQPEVRARIEAWADDEPALGGCADAHAVIRLVVWQGRRPSGQARRVMSVLLRRSADPVAARTLLQALVPRIKAERVLVPEYGHCVGEAWQLPCDTVADLVAECFAAVKRHAGEVRDDVARLVMQEATRKLRTARQAQRRYHQRTVVLVPDDAPGAAADLSAARSGAEWLATAVAEAVRSQRISKRQAQLLYGARVAGFSASEVGRRAGLKPKTVYYALARAEHALVWGAA
jgi:DNA-directed RNA polymerase specialized sigma24 family protein